MIISMHGVFVCRTNNFQNANVSILHKSLSIQYFLSFLNVKLSAKLYHIVGGSNQCFIVLHVMLRRLDLSQRKRIAFIPRPPCCLRQQSFGLSSPRSVASLIFQCLALFTLNLMHVAENTDADLHFLFKRIMLCALIYV